MTFKPSRRRSSPMRPREAISAEVPMPSLLTRRIDATEKARQLVGREPASPPIPVTVKLATRVLMEQMAWLREEAARYRELIRQAGEKNLDGATQAYHQVRPGSQGRPGQ